MLSLKNILTLIDNVEWNQALYIAMFIQEIWPINNYCCVDNVITTMTGDDLCTYTVDSALAMATTAWSPPGLQDRVPLAISWGQATTTDNRYWMSRRLDRVRAMQSQYNSLEHYNQSVLIDFIKEIYF